MKLSFLVDFVRQLESVPVSGIREANERRLQELTIKVCNHPTVKFDQFCQRLQLDKVDLNEQFDQLNSTVAELLLHAQQQIDLLVPEIKAQCMQWFTEQESPFGRDRAVLDRRLAMPNDVRERLRATLAKNQHWRWPGMIVRPGLESFVDDMVAMDPLYMVDVDLNLLKPALNRFHPNYQQRVAKYSITEQLGQPILANLPQGQMGYCFLFNYLNYRPLELVQQWLDELWHLMRPGGRILFTYNDCDRPHGISLAEKNFMAYTPGGAIREHAQNLGFEIIDQGYAPADVSWMELLRPGELTSRRGSQTLAKILARSK